MAAPDSRWLAVILLPLTMLTSFLSGPARAENAAAAEEKCAALAATSFLAVGGGDAATKVLEAKFIVGMSLNGMEEAIFRGSRVMSAPERAADVKLADHCLVSGYINPHVQFEMRLPAAAAWNGKFLLGACNGFCGRIDPYVTVTGVMRKYATMTTDGGHTGSSAFDSIWARDNMQARIDFGYRANHVALLAAKAIINAYYGQEQRYSYLTGCSKGGQAGVMAAQRYPHDFQGIIARGPTIDYTGVNILHCGQKARAIYRPDGTVTLTSARKQLIMDAVMKYCDPKDGLRDGLISDPRKCDFDPKLIQCASGQAEENCLSATEASALRTLYEPVRDSGGNIIYPPLHRGSELEWDTWVLPKDPSHIVRSSLALRGYLSGIAFVKAPPPDYDWRSFDWERDRDRLYEVSAVVDATNPDLREFRNAGGKLIVTHGWSDEAITAGASIKWYDDVVTFMGGRAKTMEFARLFLMPGMVHCGSNGIGPSTYDALSALEAWVERGRAPEMLLTLKETQDGVVSRTRPVYPYPIQARYKGRGSIDDAASFAPHEPR